MTDLSSGVNADGRLGRVWVRLKLWLNNSRSRRRPSGGDSSHRAAAWTQPPQVEPLEPRSTISDALFGLIWPMLLEYPGPADAELGGAYPELFGESRPFHGTLFSRHDLSALLREPATTWKASALWSDQDAAGAWGREGQASQSGFPGPTWTEVFPAFTDSPESRFTKTTSVGNIPASMATPGMAGPEYAAVPRDVSAVRTYADGRSFLAPADVGGLVLLAGSLGWAGPAADEPPLEASGPGGFEVSWQAGSKDPSGQLTGGTELMYLVPHAGSLFAATGQWMNRPAGRPTVGPQVLRLDAPDGQWQLDHHFGEQFEDERYRYVRVEALKSVTFTTDGQGKFLEKPVTLLLAAVIDLTGQVPVFSRDDATGAWTETILTYGELGSQVRALGFHNDAVTGVDRVFAGGSNIGTFSGVYDPDVPGRIRWGKEAELAHDSRAMAFTEANGALYVAAKPALYRRFDGPEPSWQAALTYEDPPALLEGLRGLTPVPSPNEEEEILLASLESRDFQIARILPEQGEYVVELDVKEFLVEQWGRLLVNVLLAAYNDMVAVVDPTTGETVHLIGLLAYPPLGQPQRSSWYLVRHADARYDLREIPVLPHPTIPNPFLRSTRTMVVSPFPEDAGQVVYFGGFDAQYLPAYNTAWIYRAPLETVLGGP